MLSDLSVFKLASAMARHSGAVHRATADNLARIDIPDAKASSAGRFEDALGRLGRGEALTLSSTRAPIALDEQMAQLARNAGRHEMATAVYGKMSALVRLAGSAPR